MTAATGTLSSRAFDATRQIAQLLGLTKVVWVDDVFATGIEDLIAECQEDRGSMKMVEGLLACSLAGLPPDLQSAEIRQAFERADAETRRAVIRAARGKRRMGEQQSAPPVEQTLRRMFGSDVSHEYLGMVEWRERKNGLVPPNGTESVLVLFDRDFRNEEDVPSPQDAGLRELAELLYDVERPAARAALVTQTVTTDSLVEARDALADQFALPPERFLVVPRTWLNDDSQAPSLARGLRLSLLGPSVSVLKARYCAALHTACSSAAQWIDHDWDLEDFDQAVFRSAGKAGVSELDALARLMSLRVSAELARAVHADEHLLKAAQIARNVSAVDAPEGNSQPLSRSHLADVQASEWYEEADVVNGLHLPLELGDVFEVTDADGCRNAYIVIAQPCELAVRPGGTRDSRYDRLLVALCPIQPAGPKDARAHLYFPLRYYSLDPELATHYVAFSQRHLVAPWVLDLSVMNPDGAASLAVGSVAPSLLSAAWRSRHGKLLAEVESVLDTASALPGTHRGGNSVQRLLDLHVSPDGLLRMEVDQGGRALRISCRRIRRLRRPYSLFLLNRYSQAIAREAYPHDLLPGSGD